MLGFIKRIIKIQKNILNRTRNRLIPTAYILLYHRIADVKDDPLQLSVNPENFKNQLLYLKQKYNIVPLVQLVMWLRKGGLKDNSVAVTFDDGYADNLHNALPILKELNVPATIFITSGYISSNRHFYWDGNTRPEDRGRPLTHDELIELAKCNLIEIGAHTISHPRLSALPLPKQEEEINGSKKQIEKVLNYPQISLAYPFGDKESFDKNAIEIVKKSGFNYACSNIHERVTKNSNLYALPRFVVRNWNEERF